MIKIIAEDDHLKEFVQFLKEEEVKEVLPRGHKDLNQEGENIEWIMINSFLSNLQ